MSGQASHHVAFGVEHQDAIVAADGLDDQMQHGLRLAAANAAENQEMPCLAVEAERDRRHQLDAAPVNPAFARAGSREGFQPRRAYLQPRAPRDLEGGAIGAKAKGESEQRHEADRGPADDRHAAKLESVQRTVSHEPLPTGLPIIIGGGVIEERQRSRLEASLNAGCVKRHAPPIGKHCLRRPLIEAEIISAGHHSEAGESRGERDDLQAPAHAALPVLSPVSALSRASNMASRSRAA